MGELVKGARLFVFQQYRPKKTLDPAYGNIKPHDDETIKQYATIIESYVNKIVLRV